MEFKSVTSFVYFIVANKRLRLFMFFIWAKQPSVVKFINKNQMLLFAIRFMLSI